MVLLTNMDGALRFTGPDARSFLQGQLTHDLRLLGPERPLLTAHCTPQGRVVAVVKLIQQDDAILALLPAAMVEPLMNTLRRYVLRAKVVMADATADPALADQLLPDTVEARLQAIAAGRPQVYPATREMFVAQMLNLDLIDGISFSKGCYTGQEIVARAHYRGRVKRRMQRLRTLEPCELAPGAEGRLTDGRSFQVVLSAPLPDGRCEFLAVAPLAASSAAEADPAGSRALSLAAEALPLPYLLPE